MPDPNSVSAKERAARSRLRQLLNEPALLRANLVEMERVCGSPSCRCAKSKRYWHVSWYASQSQKGKPRMKCIPSDQVDEVRQWVERYQEARSLLAVVGDVSWDRIGKRRNQRA
jgi:uncharacterized protein DUF6788